MNRFLLSVTFLLSLAAVILAPNLFDDQGQLSVIVTDSDLRPLPGATVELCSPTLQRIRLAITDAKGTCIFPDLPPGSYQIMCELAGFKSMLRKNVRILSTPVTLKISMEEGFLIEEHMDFVAPPIDPSVTSFTSEDAIILREASLSLNESIASSWECIAAITDVCDKRAILKEVLRKWKGSLVVKVIAGFQALRGSGRPARKIHHNEERYHCREICILKRI